MDLEAVINQLSLNAILIGGALLVVLVFLAIWVNKRKKLKNLKKPVFILIVAVVITTTLTISSATVYLNVKSATGGPVHWHADLEFWACGNELELREPKGVLSNKIGTPTLHEHDDKRIHLEGVPVSLPHDASLGKFMDVVGGQISQSNLVLPLNDEKIFENGKGEEDGDGHAVSDPILINSFLKTNKDGYVASFINGQKCGEKAAAVQVFAYKFNEADKTYRQTKLSDPAKYAITDESEVPPGDCLIIEFAAPKDRTDKLCKQYGVRDLDRCSDFGVTAEGRKICEIREVK